MSVKPVFIPVLTSPAGLCLTQDNWREAGSTSAAFYLESLLIKPGIALLQSTDVRSYLGSPALFILNAMDLKSNREGIYSLVSPYDGHRVKLNQIELVDLILHIKPDLVVLPKKIIQNYPELWATWDANIIPLIHAEELDLLDVPVRHGAYFNQDIIGCRDDLLKHYAAIPRYVRGELSLELMNHYLEAGVDWLESDAPANHAFNGSVYSDAGLIDLTKEDCAQQFEIISSDCACPTCTQRFTKAYLHHLFLHTPLLCQRLLIQHNIFWVNKVITM